MIFWSKPSLKTLGLCTLASVIHLNLMVAVAYFCNHGLRSEDTQGADLVLQAIKWHFSQEPEVVAFLWIWSHNALVLCFPYLLLIIFRSYLMRLAQEKPVKSKAETFLLKAFLVAYHPLILFRGLFSLGLICINIDPMTWSEIYNFSMRLLLPHAILEFAIAIWMAYRCSRIYKQWTQTSHSSLSTFINLGCIQGSRSSMIVDLRWPVALLAISAALEAFVTPMTMG
jgi:hypothetical protein